MDEYRESMKDGISQALKLAAKGSAKVIYFEYDMDNGWNSNFLFVMITRNFLKKMTSGHVTGLRRLMEALLKNSLRFI